MPRARSHRKARAGKTSPRPSRARRATRTRLSRSGRPGGTERGRVSADFLDLSIRELSRNFGRRRALTRVSLDCRSGEIVGLLGPNGAGKSTLLAILSTLAAPSSGEVLYGGR